MRDDKLKQPKRTPILVKNPTPRSKQAVTEIDVFGHPKKVVDCESPEAAGHWDARYWHKLL